MYSAILTMTLMTGGDVPDAHLFARDLLRGGCSGRAAVVERTHVVVRERLVRAPRAGCHGAAATVRTGCTGGFANPVLVVPSTIPQPMPAPQAAPEPSKKVGAVQSTTTTTTVTTTTVDALDAVNAKRARMGLRPFLRDENLTVGAVRAATYRARVRLFGHVMTGAGDFQFLPPGTTARAAGCAAYAPSYGFMACCVDDRTATYAGAAQVLGDDGRVYSHIFVR